MKWIDYRETLGVAFSDTKKAEMLSSKISILFDEISEFRNQNEFRNQDEDRICMQYFSYIGETNAGTYYTWHRVSENITSKKAILDLVSYTVALSIASRKAGFSQFGELVLNNLVNFMNELKLDYELFRDDDGVFIYPRGAKELDEANVSVPFEWLKTYPASRKAMEKALRAYSDNEAPSEVADLFRKALETFTQEFFDSSASLENIKGDIGRFLKGKGVPKELSGNFETTLQMYTNFMNNYAKHHDKTEKQYLEFIMYQTGNIIRFIISLSRN